MCKIVSLDETDTVLARHSTFHLHGTLDHTVDHAFGHLLLPFVEQDNCYRMLAYGLKKKN